MGRIDCRIQQRRKCAAAHCRATTKAVGPPEAAVEERNGKANKGCHGYRRDCAILEFALVFEPVSIAGGGPPPEPVDERLSQIEAAALHLSEPIKNPYDSDRPPSTQPGDSVADIIAGMTQSNAKDSDDDRTLELSSTDYLYVDSANARSPLPADPTEASSEPVQCRQQASQQT
nr:uncharacterized protein LOC126537939 [Dermacentor andersoni]